MPYKPLGLPYVRLGKSIRYIPVDVARWVMDRRSQKPTETEVQELIDALGGADQLLDEKEVSRITGLAQATLQTDRCRSAIPSPYQKANSHGFEPIRDASARVIARLDDE